MNAAQEKQKTSCPLGASSLGRKTVSTGETHLECGRAREREQGPPEEKDESVKSEQTSETRKKAVMEEGWDCSRAWKGEGFVGVGLVA